MKKTGQASDDLPRLGKILLNVALVVNRDDGDSGLSGNVIGNSDFTCVHGSNESFIVSLGKAVTQSSQQVHRKRGRGCQPCHLQMCRRE